MINGTHSQRVFVGIKLLPEVAEYCVKLQADAGDIPGRFIPPEDMHVTLLPPIEMADHAFVVERLRTVVKTVEPFTLILKRFTYGPNVMRPRYLWVECAATAEIVALKKDLTAAFNGADQASFTPHITLARLREEDHDTLVHHAVDRPVELSMPVDSIELFASPNQGGIGYSILESFALTGKNIPG